MITFTHRISTEDYNKLRAAVGWEMLPEEQAANGLQGTAYMIVAKDDDRTIGLTRLVSDGGYIAYIADVIVHPDYQGKGIGKHLLLDVLQHIKDGMKEGYLVHVNLVAAKGKETFYEKFGFWRRPTDFTGAGMSMRLHYGDKVLFEQMEDVYED